MKKSVILLLLAFSTWCSAENTTDTPSTADPTAGSTDTSATPMPTDAPTAAPANPPPPPAAQQKKLKQYDFSGPLTELQGSYLLKSRDQSQARPSWASVWSVTETERNFGIYFWPPNYCHAVYLCLVPAKLYDGENQHFDSFDCDTNYIKYYPHISKLLYKPKDGAEESYFYVKSSLQFQKSDDKHVLNVLEALPVGHYEWKQKKEEDFKKLEIDFEGKDLLILTNSRMCEVNKPGSRFHPIFDFETYDKNGTIKDSWPNWLFKNTQTIPTDSLPALGGREKSIDLLEFLKKSTVAGNKLGNIVQKCAMYDKIGITKLRKPAFERAVSISALSYEIFEANTQANETTREYEFTVSNCEWIRIWASDKTMKEYATAMKVDETLDVFLSAGYYVPPDSDQALPLPDYHLIDKLKLTVMKDPAVAGDNHELIEFAFGSVNNAYLFRRHFKSKAFGVKNLNIHVIRSEKCEANIAVKPSFYAGYSNEPYNYKQVRSCEFNYITEPSS
ncbi:Lipoprotein [Caenorhabditis elegans]|uniref:Lipoprotein n=1 Tax=Caenorhabditis elegans TaxID=6239 RepID=Q9U2G6_CAEEL|nr:Lipoprotein [Caenorhabditis elegans]CAA21643.2 Lipoprotein [Caenorhabditis elegans]|eukprot:NP_507770.1 Uncharacterized protein CELE_Y43F8A.2 [Caenorhabditis elegans]